MIGLLCFILAVLASPFRSKLRLEAENAVLLHQLIVLRRKLRGGVRLTNHGVYCARKSWSVGPLAQLRRLGKSFSSVDTRLSSMFPAVERDV
jgi:hypothetical protein